MLILLEKINYTSNDNKNVTIKPTITTNTTYTTVITITTITTIIFSYSKKYAYFPYGFKNYP